VDGPPPGPCRLTLAPLCPTGRNRLPPPEREVGSPSEDSSGAIWPEHPVFHAAPSGPTCPVPKATRTILRNAANRNHRLLLAGHGTSLPTHVRSTQ
jgi:hypothetical protein